MMLLLGSLTFSRLYVIPQCEIISRKSSTDWKNKGKKYFRLTCKDISNDSNKKYNFEFKDSKLKAEVDDLLDEFSVGDNFNISYSKIGNKLYIADYTENLRVNGLDPEDLMRQ